MIYDHIYKLALELEKRVEDLGSELSITDPLMEDLIESIERTQNGLTEAKGKIEGDPDRKYNQKTIEAIRDYAGHLALLCNMILSGKEYSEEEKIEAIHDDL